MHRGVFVFSSLALALACAAAIPAIAQTPGSESGKVVGVAFVGRIVADLDRSVAFYRAIGFTQDPAADPAWRTDEVVEHLYGATGIRTRMAKMFVRNADSGQRFVVYLRELKGIDAQISPDIRPGTRA